MKDIPNLVILLCPVELVLIARILLTRLTSDLD
jgi:hypothetical protein